MAEIYKTFMTEAAKLGQDEPATSSRERADATELEIQARIDAAVADERKRQICLLQACLDGAVMSKYATRAECEAARAALRNAMRGA